MREVAQQQAAEFGFHALATLATLEGIAWQNDATKQGQLRQDHSSRHLLVWRDARQTKAQMRAVLSFWQQQGDGHSDLVVLAQSRVGDIDEGVVAEARRVDFSSAPLSAAGARGGLAPRPADYTAPRGRRCLAVVSLAHVASVYADYRPGVDDAPLVDALQARIGAALP